MLCFVVVVFFLTEKGLFCNSSNCFAPTYIQNVCGETDRWSYEGEFLQYAQPVEVSLVGENGSQV